jgi:hypothetical protein
MYGTVSAKMYFGGYTIWLRYDNTIASRKRGASMPLWHSITTTVKLLEQASASSYLHKTLGSQGGDCENYCLLRCDAISVVQRLQCPGWICCLQPSFWTLKTDAAGSS